MSRRCCGFTLLELMVAIAIFSFLATAMYTGIRQIVIEREVIVARADELANLQRAVRYLNTDFAQMHPRVVRDELGRDKLGALITDPSSDTVAIEFSRDGWRNPASRPRGTLQRVQYRIEEDVLIREYWPVMDRLLGDEPRTLELLEGVEDMEIAFLDQDNEWQPDWPPTNAGNVSLDQLPKAVRYRFTLDSFGEIERIVEVP